mmetsp:Transcript_15799/g.32412  ORF Transcript_15799/g.32412 Transcript_15799/m.32412 type:complete len:313 (+) Transcript_15799:3-941(+)
MLRSYVLAPVIVLVCFQTAANALPRLPSVFRFPLDPRPLLTADSKAQVHSATTKTDVQAAGATPPGIASKSVARSLDTIIAGVGLGLTIATLAALDSYFNLKVFCPPMLASGTIFFAGPTPPDISGFAKATLGAVAVYNILGLVRTSLSQPVVMGAMSGCMLMWFKATNAIFPACVSLGLLLAQAAPSSEAQQLSWAGVQASLNYALFPWVSGNIALYVMAILLSLCRWEVRNRVMKSELRALSAQDLRRTFKQFDTSGDGYLDATEVKVALRAAIGCDVALADCERLVGEADTDGDGVVDFHEFQHICSAT